MEENECEENGRRWTLFSVPTRSYALRWDLVVQSYAFAQGPSGAASCWGLYVGPLAELCAGAYTTGPPGAAA